MTAPMPVNPGQTVSLSGAEHMSHTTLTKEQLDALNDGESVDLNVGFHGETETVEPPCETSEHEWRYGIKAQDGKMTRDCVKCGADEETEVDIDGLFEEV